MNGSKREVLSIRIAAKTRRHIARRDALKRNGFVTRALSAIPETACRLNRASSDLEVIAPVRPARRPWQVLAEGDPTV